MLTRRDHTCAQLEKKLVAKGHGADEIGAAMQQCTDWGYLDDYRFGRGRVEARLRRRPAGRADALRDLRRQGLTETMSAAVADEVFEAIGGERGALGEAFDRWVAQHGEPEDLTAAKRCFDHLMRRSFPRYLVLQELSPWLDDLTA